MRHAITAIIIIFIFLHCGLVVKAKAKSTDEIEELEDEEFYDEYDDISEEEGELEMEKDLEKAEGKGDSGGEIERKSNQGSKIEVKKKSIASENKGSEKNGEGKKWEGRKRNVNHEGTQRDIGKSDKNMVLSDKNTDARKIKKEDTQKITDKDKRTAVKKVHPVKEAHKVKKVLPIKGISKVKEVIPVKKSTKVHDIQPLDKITKIDNDLVEAFMDDDKDLEEAFIDYDSDLAQSFMNDDDPDTGKMQLETSDKSKSGARRKEPHQNLETNSSNQSLGAKEEKHSFEILGEIEGEGISTNETSRDNLTNYNYNNKTSNHCEDLQKKVERIKKMFEVADLDEIEVVKKIKVDDISKYEEKQQLTLQIAKTKPEDYDEIQEINREKNEEVTKAIIDKIKIEEIKDKLRLEEQKLEAIDEMIVDFKTKEKKINIKLDGLNRLREKHQKKENKTYTQIQNLEKNIGSKKVDLNLNVIEDKENNSSLQEDFSLEEVNQVIPVQPLIPIRSIKEILKSKYLTNEQAAELIKLQRRRKSNYPHKLK